jgi:hypothetical protein
MKDDRRWICGVCKAVFDDPKQLHDHIHSNHQAELKMVEDASDRYRQSGDAVELLTTMTKLGHAGQRRE